MATVSRRAFLVGFFLVWALTSRSWGLEPFPMHQYTFRYFDLPLPSPTEPAFGYTAAEDANVKQDVLLRLLNAQGEVAHYIVTSLGETVRLTCPNQALLTQASSLNRHGQFTATCQTPTGDLGVRGRMTGGRMFDNMAKTITVPGTHTTVLTSINDPGQIAGYASDPTTGLTQGFIWQNEQFMARNAPAAWGALGTMLLGLNRTRDAVGIYLTSLSTRGVVFLGSTPQSLELPDTHYALPWDINDTREVVGVAEDQALGLVGFVMSQNIAYHLTVPLPGTVYAEPLSINAQGQIAGRVLVGAATNPGQPYAMLGFVATPLPGTSLGQVAHATTAGWATAPGQLAHTAGQMSTLAAPPVRMRLALDTCREQGTDIVPSKLHGLCR